MDGHDDLLLGEIVAERIRGALVARLAAAGYGGDGLTEGADLKSPHKLDYAAADAARAALSGQRCNIFVESQRDRFDPDAEFSVYIDPLDGSLNWERGVGDPCVVVATADCARIRSLSDLRGAYVLGLRSGDRYYTRGDEAWYINGLTGKASIISSRKDVQLRRGLAYVRPGYGMAALQLQRALPIMLYAGDVRSFENSGIEFCEIARGAADLMVEARSRGQRGSDFFNLLAWPILRNAGGVLCDLEGNDLTPQPIDPHGYYNYIAAGSLPLAIEAAEQMGTFRSKLSERVAEFILPQA